MKISEYNQMKKWLTRPDSLPLAERKAIEQKQAKAELDRKNKKRAEYGLPPAGKKPVQLTLPGMEQKPILDSKKFVELTNLYDDNNLIVDGDGNITDEKTLKNKFEKEIVNKTKELSEDKIVTKQRPVYPKEATPEQVGQLAERLERSRQMTGAKPTKLKDLENNYKQKPFLKKKAEPVKLDFKPIDIDLPPPIERDPYLEELEKRVMANKEKSYQEKVKNNSTGLRYFAPLEVKRDE